eukprot:3782413-Alexandrium_andersonii.AAC.1
MGGCESSWTRTVGRFFTVPWLAMRLAVAAKGSAISARSATMRATVDGGGLGDDAPLALEN